MQHAQSTAAGMAIPAVAASSFAVTQAMWRFLANERVLPIALVEPLRLFAQEQISEGTPYVLAVVDWSKLDYFKHTAKKDTVQLTHKLDVGYELTSQLLVDAGTGRPIAPIQMHIKTANGYLSTADTPVPDEHRLEQVTPMMKAAAEMNFGTKLVHVIDREADSVWHLRQWDAAGELFLVRGDDRIVCWNGKMQKYSNIEAELEAQGHFIKTREVTIKGRKGIQYTAETKIILNRPAVRTVNGQKVRLEGKALELRLVIAKVYDAQNQKLLSTWYLLSNVPDDVSGTQIALWYYFRWDIESYFKLMKSGGLQLEHWQQESGPAILKRLLVASMAAALVWQLQALETPEAKEFKELLTRLSGKSVKRGRPATAGVLFSGLFVLLRIYDFFEHIDFDLSQLDQIKNMLKKFLAFTGWLLK